MNPYSQDLRERVIAATDEGTETQPEVAERFGVSVSFITKLRRRRRDAGTVAAKPHAGGFAPALAGPRLRALSALVAAQPDATLAELRDRLASRRRGGARVGRSTVWRALARLGLPLKKSRRTPTSGTRPGSAGCGGRTPGR
jgi:transposase